MDHITYHERLFNFLNATEKSFVLTSKPKIVSANKFLIVNHLKGEAKKARADLSRYNRLKEIAKEELMSIKEKENAAIERLKAISKEYYRLGGKDA